MSEKKLRILFAQLNHTTLQNVGIEFLNSTVSKKFSQATTPEGILITRESHRTFEIIDDDLHLVRFEPGTPRTVESGTKIIYSKPQHGGIALVWARLDEFQKIQLEV